MKNVEKSGKISVLLIIGLILISYSSGIAGLVTGKIFDAENNLPLKSATVSLIKLPDSTLASGKIADKDGGFMFDNINYGKYLLKISYTGYQTKMITDIDLSGDKETYNFSNINLNSSGAVTSDIVVTADKPNVEFSFGKQIINVDKNTVSAGGSAIDVLKTAPSVEVSQDGKISLRGSGDVRILINGKPASITSSNISNILEQIPAAAIETIELITNPSAKYDAKGNSGIINIVMKKETKSGVNGMANLNIGNGDKYNGSLNTNYKTGDFNLFASYDFVNDIRRPSHNADRQSMYFDTVLYLSQRAPIYRKVLSNAVRGGLDYTINEQNSLSLSGGFSTNTNDLTSDMSFINRYENGQIYNSFLRKVQTEQPNTNYDFSLNYKKLFDDKSHQLTFDAYYSEMLVDINATSGLNYSVNPANLNDRLYRVKHNNDIRTWTLQTDYAYPISEKMKLEAGLKTEIQDYNSDYAFSEFNKQNNNWVNDPEATNNFVFNEDTYSGYLMLSGEIDDFGYQLGLRAENTSTSGELTTTGESFAKNYTDFFPSAVFSYKFAMTDQMQLSYSRRIDRPVIWFLNPYQEKSDPLNIRYGNFDVMPYYTNSLELGYMKFIGSHYIMPSVFFKSTTNALAMYSYSNSAGQLYTTYRNMSDLTTYGIELNYQANAFDWWSYGVSISYYYQDVKSYYPELAFNTSNYTGNIRGNTNLKLTEELGLQLFGMYSPEIISPQGKRFETYFVDAALNYDITPNLSVNFKVSDVFNTMVYGGSTQGMGYYMSQNFYPESRVANISISYKINEGIKPNRNRRAQPAGDGAPPSGI